MQPLAKLLSMALLTIVTYSTKAQSIQWQKAWGGTADDMVLSIIQTPDEGFVVGGVTASKDGDITNSKGKGDLWVMKLTKNGIPAWKKTLGGPNEEQGCVVLPTADGGYLIAGNTSSNSGDVKGYHGGVTDVWGNSGYDIWVVKLNASGTLLWQRCLGGSKVDELFNVTEVANGYLVAGNTNSADGDVRSQHGDFDIWLVELSTDGNILNSRTLGGPGTEKIRDLQVRNGEIFFAGYTTASGGDVTNYHGGNTDIWVGRLSSLSGNLWQKNLGGTRAESDYSNFIRPTADGGFLAMGVTSSNDGDVANTANVQSGWIVKFTDGGAILWQSTMPESNDIAAPAMLSDESIVFGTTLYEVVNGTRMANPTLIKLDFNGNLVWSHPTLALPLVINATADEGLILFGHSNVATIPGFHKGYDAWMKKLNGSGNTIWEKAYGGTNNDFLQGRTAVYSGNTFPISTGINGVWANYIPAVAAKDGGYFFAVSTGSIDGDVSGFHYNKKAGYRFDIWVVKLSPAASSATSAKIVKQDFNDSKIFKHSVFPNPARHFATIQFTAIENGDAIIELYNSAGAKMQTIIVENVSAGVTVRKDINLSSFPAGEYIYRLKQGVTKHSGIINKLYR